MLFKFIFKSLSFEIKIYMKRESLNQEYARDFLSGS